jgi:hypothetical protein
MQTAASMPSTTDTAKVKLVTIVTAEELLDGLAGRLKMLGTSGYTVVRADGYGLHGPRRASFLALANVRVEILLRPADAQRLLELLAHDYESGQLVAFSHDVEAVPKAHFE